MVPAAGRTLVTPFAFVVDPSEISTVGFGISNGDEMVGRVPVNAIISRLVLEIKGPESQSRKMNGTVYSHTTSWKTTALTY